LISRCSPGSTITLWPTLDAALARKVDIDRFACGGWCRRYHVIYQLGPVVPDA
jgi:hypothetical protein